MTTETPPAIDPTIEAWSDRLEEELIEVGMEPRQARAYQRAFELGMTRVMSVMATKDELHREIDRLERWLILIGGAAIGLLITLVVRSFA